MATKVGDAYIEVEPRLTRDFNRDLHNELNQQVSKVNVNLPPLKMAPGWDTALRNEITPKLQKQMAETRKEIEKGHRLGAIELGPGWNRDIDQKLTAGIRDAIAKANKEAKIAPTFEMSPQFKDGLSKMRAEVQRSVELGTVNLSPGWNREIDAKLTAGIKSAIANANKEAKFNPTLNDDWKNQIGPKISTDMRFALAQSRIDKLLVPGPSIDPTWKNKVSTQVTEQMKDALDQSRRVMERQQKIEMGQVFTFTRMKEQVNRGADDSRSGLLSRFTRMGTDSAFDFGKEFANTLSALPSSFLVRAFMTPLGPAMAAVGAAAAVAIASVLVPALAAAILAGIAAGPIAIGIATMIKDPRIESAINGLKKTVIDTFQDISEGFVGPIQRSIAILNDVFNRHIAPSFERMVGTLAPLTEGLTRGLANFIQQLMPGLEKVVTEIEPIFAVIIEHMPKLAHSLTDALALIAKHSDELAMALDYVLLAVENIIETIGFLVVAFAEAFEFIIDRAHDFTDIMANALDILGKVPHFDWANAAADQLRAAGDAMQTLGANGEITKGSLDELTGSAEEQAAAQAEVEQAIRDTNQALDEQYAKSISVIDAHEDWNRGMLDLQGTLAKNGADIRDNTKAGLDNRDALQEMITKSREMYITDIEGGVPMGQATQRHKDRTAAVIEEARKTGLNTEEVRKLLEKYGQVPTDLTTIAKLQGFADVDKALKGLLILQLAGKDGISIEDATKKINTGLTFRGLSTGGLATGPGGPRDDRAGLFALSDGEFVQQTSAVQHYGRDFMEKLNRRQIEVVGRRAPGFATGGFVRTPQARNINPVARVKHQPYRQHTWKGDIDVSKFMIPQMEADLGGGSGGSARIIELAKKSGIPHTVGSTFRPGSRAENGNLDWHSQGNAVDFPGFNQDAFATYWLGMAGSLLELIHRTRKRDYGISNGKPFTKSGNESLYNGHRDHVHVAMHGNAGVGSTGNALSKITGMAGGAIRDANKLSSAAKGWITAGRVATSAPASWQMPLQSLAWRESGGNPNARSFSSNGSWGYAIGLIQLLQSTFDAYRNKSLPNDRRHPVANVAAGINWIRARYGDIYRLPHAVGERPSPGGYDGGGVVPDGMGFFNSAGAPEMVLNPPQATAFLNRIEGGDPQVLNITIDLGHGIHEVVQIELKDNNAEVIAPLNALRR